MNVRKRSKITHVAVRYNEVIYSLSCPPNRHHDVNYHIIEKTGVDHVPYRGEDQGFLDEEGNFLTRKQAFISASLHDQVINEETCYNGELYSENLFRTKG